jgi:hypothetical protein
LHGCDSGQAENALAMPVPELAFGGARIITRFGHRVEMLCCAMLQVVAGPSRVAGGGESDPGSVHHVGYGARWVWTEQWRHQRVLNVVEGEGELGEVAGANAAAEGWRTPAELIQVSGTLALFRMRLGQPNGGKLPPEGRPLRRSDGHFDTPSTQTPDRARS